MSASLTERLRAIREGLDELRGIDVAYRIHGSEPPAGHGHRALPPLSEAEVEALESEAGVRLPEELRRFVLEVSAGGMGPGYGLTLLDHLSGDHLQAPFPLDHAAGEAVIEARRSGRDTGDFVDADSRSRDGVLELSHFGCGWYTAVVLEGPMRGDVWTVGDFGWCPHFDEDTGARLSFLDWFEHWLRESLRTVSAPLQIEPGTRALKLLRQLNAEIPDVVWTATEAEHLDLRNNHLSEIPSAIGELTRLRRLQLSSNHFERLPVELFSLTELERLDLDHNRVTELPAELGQLRRLERLSVRNNPLEHVGDVSSLERLTSLNLAATRLGALPKGLGSTALEILRLNDIDSLDLAGLEGCTRLQQLHLNRAGLTEWHPALFELPSLTRLALNHNELTSVPEALGQLDQLVSLGLSFNPIARLPACIASMSALQRVVLIEVPLAEGERERLVRLRPDVEFVFEAVRPRLPSASRAN